MEKKGVGWGGKKKESLWTSSNPVISFFLFPYPSDRPGPTGAARPKAVSVHYAARTRPWGRAVSICFRQWELAGIDSSSDFGFVLRPNILIVFLRLNLLLLFMMTRMVGRSHRLASLPTGLALFGWHCFYGCSLLEWSLCGMTRLLGLLRSLISFVM